MLSSYPSCYSPSSSASSFPVIHFSRASAQCPCSRHYQCLVHFSRASVSCVVFYPLFCAPRRFCGVSPHTVQHHMHISLIHYSLLHISKATVTHMASALVSLSALWFVCSQIYRAQKVLVHRCDMYISSCQCTFIITIKCFDRLRLLRSDCAVATWYGKMALGALACASANGSG